MKELLWSGIIAATLTVMPLSVCSAAESPDAPLVVDNLRIFPAKGHEEDVVGGKIEGSNQSATEGFELLTQINDIPTADQWTNIQLNNKKVFRYWRYCSPKGSHCRIAELELYAGKRQLKGQSFGSFISDEPPGAWTKAFDGKTNTYVERSAADDQYIGLDLQDLATPRIPGINPPGGHYKSPQQINIASRTPDSTIIYTLDGSIPTDHPQNGLAYTTPLQIGKNTVLQAVAIGNKDRDANDQRAIASPPAYAVYLIGEPRLSFTGLHVGNSLTASTHNLALFASTLGYLELYQSFLHGGATTKVLWEDATGVKKDQWEKVLLGAGPINHFTLQPRDFNLDQEADYDMRFLNVVRQQSPDVQPWLYAEWVEFNRHRPTDLGTYNSPQMTKTWPAQTWEESMGAMVLYVEDLQTKIAQLEKSQSFKSPKIIPSALAMGWMQHLIDQGKVPDMPPGSFHEKLFSDAVHPNNEGQYFVDLTWLCALTGKPVTGTIPLTTKLTPAQASIMQKLAWDVVQNYPASGWFKSGSKAVALPKASISKGTLTDTAKKTGTTYDITSKTEGAWFRYTLDGSEPTPTHGYVYCGAVTVPADAILKIISYKNGMAISKPVTILKDSKKPSK